MLDECYTIGLYTCPFSHAEDGRGVLPANKYCQRSTARGHAAKWPAPCRAALRFLRPFELIMGTAQPS